jgi:hypothetical protein
MFEISANFQFTVVIQNIFFCFQSNLVQFKISDFFSLGLHEMKLDIVIEDEIKLYRRPSLAGTPKVNNQTII